MANTGLVVDNGLNEILDAFVATQRYIAIGSGTTAESGTDTALVTEVLRVAASTQSVSGNMATFKGFFNTTQGNGIIGECALAVGSIAAADIITRSVESPTKTKTNTQEMLVEISITLERV